MIAYWSGGGVLRWNQILRELVARYNLPPAPRADGTYPAPDAANPFADPAFPFSNPPYAARAYSYVSVAQFEALKAAWAYKYQYNRPAPVARRQRRAGAGAAGDLPAYPSEDAVLSGVERRPCCGCCSPPRSRRSRARRPTSATRRLVGPRRPQRHRRGPRARQCRRGLFRRAPPPTGCATRSARARSGTLSPPPPGPGARSPGPASTPRPRPPMLPFFGQVRGLGHDRDRHHASGRRRRPSTSSAADAAGAGGGQEVLGRRDPREVAIANKWSDGAGTYTPPGHWNDLAAEHIRDASWSEVRSARAFALLNMAMHDAAVGCWETKYFYFNPRPISLDPERQDRHRPAQLPRLYVRPLDLLGRGGGGAVLPVPRRARRSSRRPGTRRASRASTAPSTTARTSTWARTTAGASAGTRSSSRARTGRIDLGLHGRPVRTVAAPDQGRARVHGGLWPPGDSFRNELSAWDSTGRVAS